MEEELKTREEVKSEPGGVRFASFSLRQVEQIPAWLSGFGCLPQWESVSGAAIDGSRRVRMDRLKMRELGFGWNFDR